MSLPRYPEYKDSKDSLFGSVPSHWFRSALKRAAVYKNGYAFKQEDWEDQGTPIIRIAQLTGEAEPNCYAGELDESYRVENGDLLFSWSATIDSFIWNSGTAWLNQHIFKVSPTEEAITSYLFYLIKFVAPKLAELDAHGSTMRHIKKESLGQLVYLPTLAEQTAIATFLYRETAKIDALIAEQEKLLTLLAEKRQATISHAVTKGLTPDAPMKDSEVEWLGVVPAHWDVRRVKDVSKLESGHTPSKQFSEYWENCEIPWVSLNDSKYLAANDYITDTAVKINELGLANSSARVLPAESVVFTRDATIGLAAITTRPMAVSQHLIAWCPTGKMVPKYLLRVFNAMKSHLDSYTFGATIKTIGMGDVKTLTTPVPPIHEQVEIVQVLDTKLCQIDELSYEAIRAIDLLKERRTALISAAVTGKIDVRGILEKGTPE